MDVERMHCMIEKLSECAKSEMDNGVKNIDTREMGQVVDMLKDLSEAMYYRTLTHAMEESDTDEIMEMFDRYGDDRRYYDHYRYKDGRYAPKGHGTYRRGYREPYWHMTPDMYRTMDMDYFRDMDKDKGRMYFTEPMRDDREGTSGSSRRMYIESKELHKSNTPEDKQAKMKSLEMYMKDLAQDITGMINGATQEERALLKTKMQTLIQTI